MNEITAQLENFKQYLVSQEKSRATVEKYVRDVRVFAEFLGNSKPTRETVIAYKTCLQNNYAARSVNSMLASINCLFEFLNRYDLRVKTLKLQQQIF